MFLVMKEGKGGGEREGKADAMSIRNLQTPFADKFLLSKHEF